MLTNSACSDRELDLFPPYADNITNINTEAQLQQLLNGGYLSVASTDVFGTKVTLLGDLLSDKMFVSSSENNQMSNITFTHHDAKQKKAKKHNVTYMKSQRLCLALCISQSFPIAKRVLFAQDPFS